MFLVTFTFLLLTSRVKGHGRLVEPPSRASMWRYGFDTPRNYQDNQLFCGGFEDQRKHGGKCGVCGDPWEGPRDHEAGGIYATGTIARKYKQGQTIPITVQITANHLGWFEFRLCPVNDMKVRATQDCLDENLLSLVEGSATRYLIGSYVGMHTVLVKLPPHLTCSQCVLQWKYHAGNSWGVDEDGTGCTGCGPQEEFYACADVAIFDEYAEPVEETIEPQKEAVGETEVVQTIKSGTAIPQTLATHQQTTSSTCSSHTVAADDIVSNSWCSSNCGSGVCKKVLICA